MIRLVALECPNREVIMGSGTAAAEEDDMFVFSARRMMGHESTD